MSIDITETIERKCCKQQDLKRYKGLGSEHGIVARFCIYCGQLWGRTRKPGDMDSGLWEVLPGEYQYEVERREKHSKAETGA